MNIRIYELKVVDFNKLLSKANSPVMVKTNPALIFGRNNM